MLWLAVTAVLSAELCAVGILLLVRPTPRRLLTAFLAGLLTLPAGLPAMVPWLLEHYAAGRSE
jgi:hypothetical protein